MQTLEPLLAEHPFTKGLSDEDLKLLVGCASNARFEAGQPIFREGDEANCFYLIRSGCVAIDIYVPQRGGVTIQTLREGDLLGWSWLISPHQWHFDATALELTRALQLDATCLRTKCDQDPRIGYELFKRVAYVMSERLQATRLQLLDLYGSHA